MKEILFIIILAPSLILSQDNLKKMDKYKILKIENFDKIYDVRELKELEQIKYNLAVVNQAPDSSYIIIPQIENYVLQVKNKQQLFEIIKENKFPLTDDVDLLYYQYKNNLNDFFNSNNLIYFNEILVSKLDIDTSFLINEQNLAELEKKFEKLDLKEKNELFIPLLLLFQKYFKTNINNKNIDWDQDIKYTLQPYIIPVLIQKTWFFSFYDLNIMLEDKIKQVSKKSFKEILINQYCYYYSKRFLNTSQENYFDGQKYKKLLKKDFDNYFIFPPLQNL